MVPKYRILDRNSVERMAGKRAEGGEDTMRKHGAEVPNSGQEFSERMAGERQKVVRTSCVSMKPKYRILDRNSVKIPSEMAFLLTN